MKRSQNGSARFDAVAGDKSQVVGSLEFSTVSKLLPLGTDAIAAGQAAVIDLAGVTASDSSGLALLIEWLSVAQAAGRALRYENMPAQLHQLALLSDVEELIATTPAATPAPEAAAV